jgi:predicted phosphodiesterase
VPYEDKRAFDLMLNVLRGWGPDTVIILGDFGDFYPVSAHSKDPARSGQLADEIHAINGRLDQLDALGATEKHFVEGNHENRLSRYLADKAPELFGMVGVEDLFGLNRRGWTFTPYKQSLTVGRVNFTHDCGNAGAQAHSKALDTFQGNVVIGHTHRMAISYIGNAQGTTHVGAMFGWIGDVNRVDYMHRVQALRAWHLGFGAGYQEASGTVHLQPVPMIDYRVVLEGKLYNG